MAASFSTHTLRIACLTGQRNLPLRRLTVKNTDTALAEADYLRAGFTNTLQVGFYESDNSEHTLSGYSALTLTLYDTNGAAVITAETSSYSGATSSQFTAGTHQHASFVMPAEDTNIKLDQACVVLRWIITGNSSGTDVVLAEGFLFCYDERIGAPFIEALELYALQSALNAAITRIANLESGGGGGGGGTTITSNGDGTLSATISGTVWTWAASNT